MNSELSTLSLSNDVNLQVSSNPSITILNIMRKRPFKSRETLLTQIISTGNNEKINLAGFRYMIITILLTGIACVPLIRYLNTGYFTDPLIFQLFSEDLLFVLSLWPLFTLWSFTTFFIQKAITKGLSINIANALHYLSLTVLFSVPPYLIHKYNWLPTHGCFLLFQACIHFMKMHSYHRTNLQFRDEKLFILKNQSNPAIDRNQNKCDPNNNNNNNNNDLSNVSESSSFTHINNSNNLNLPSPYPKNINIRDFSYYLAAPVLVYWYEYPKIDYIRWKFLAHRIFLTLVGFFGMYLIGSEMLAPIVLMGKQITYIEAFMRLYMPTFIGVILIVIIIWDCLLSCYAELTKFGDRGFYQDWWNCISYEEFARKWNSSAHEFFFRHLYLEYRIRYKLSKWLSMIIILTISAIIHQYVVCFAFQKWDFSYFLCVIVQMPFSLLTNAALKKDFDVANCMFWFGGILGYTWVIINNIYQNS